MTEIRLPLHIENKICAVDDERFASTLRHYLGFSGDQYMRDSFLDALKGTDVHVYEDVAETDPNEIVVRATGTLASGSYIRHCNIMLLDPEWSKTADRSSAIAQRVIEVWDEITVMAKEGVEA